MAVVPLSEGLTLEAVQERWGQLTTDELEVARQRHFALDRPPHTGPVWLRRDGTKEEQRHAALEDAVAAWLAGGDAVLAAPTAAGGNFDELVRAFAVVAATSDEPQMLVGASEVADAPDGWRRLVERGRLIGATLELCSDIARRLAAREASTARGVPAGGGMRRIR